jgi:hypothetical protein
MGVLFMRKAVHRREETSGDRRLRNLNHMVFFFYFGGKFSQTVIGRPSLYLLSNDCLSDIKIFYAVE